MYVSFYNLSDRPFRLSPDPRFFFAGRAHRRAMAYLTHGLNEADGFLVVTGEVGTGKSTLVGHFLNQLDRDRYVAARIVTTQVGADDALRLVASAFRLPFEGLDKATLLRTLEVFLAECRRQRKSPLLVVDEAQDMPVAALEELRLLTNLQHDHRPLLQCFLLGQPQFRARVARDDMEQLRQRIVAACHLAPLDEADTRAYIEHRLKFVGWRNDPSFAGDALELIHRHSRGVPRRINSLCGRLLLFGYLEGIHHIDEGVVRRVVQELEEEIGEYGEPRPIAGDHDSDPSTIDRVAADARSSSDEGRSPAEAAASAVPADRDDTLEELARRVARLKDG